MTIEQFINNLNQIPYFWPFFYTGLFAVIVMAWDLVHPNNRKKYRGKWNPFKRSSWQTTKRRTLVNTTTKK